MQILSKDDKLLDLIREEVVVLRERIRKMEDEVEALRKVIYEGNLREGKVYYLRLRYYLTFRLELMRRLGWENGHEKDLKGSSGDND